MNEDRLPLDAAQLESQQASWLSELGNVNGARL